MSSDAEFWVITILLVGIMILLGISVQRLTTILSVVRAKDGRLG